MRLIDASKLKESIVVVYESEHNYKLVNLLYKWIDQQPTVGGWISVKGRLPENGQQVVAISVDGVCEVVNFEERTGRWLGMEGWYPTDRITHWMPLPEPPKEGSGDD